MLFLLFGIDRSVCPTVERTWKKSQLSSTHPHPHPHTQTELFSTPKHPDRTGAYSATYPIYNRRNSPGRNRPWRKAYSVCMVRPAGQPAVPYTHTPQVQNYAAKHRPSTRQNICESPRVISVKHSSVLPDDGSHKIRNMSE